MKIISIIILFLLVHQTNLEAQRDKIRFEKISIEQGLNQSSVLAICQDRKGFLWFGTYDGLVRYDGYQFKVYKFQPDDSTSLSENLVRVVFEDRFGILWVGTEGGLNKFNCEKDNFTIFLTDPNNPNSISNNRIRSIIEDKEGNLWIATEMGINQYDRKSNSFKKFFHDSNNSNTISDNFVRIIYEDKKGNIWFGTNGGLDKLDYETKKFIHFKHDPNNPKSISENSIVSILQDQKGALWFGTRNNGVIRLDPDSSKFIHYPANPDDPFCLQNGSRAIIYEDRKGNIWIGTYGGGLHKYDRENDRFINHKNNQNDNTSLSSNAIYCMHEDESGILWIGTDFGGISKYDLRKSQFVNYSPDPDRPNGLINSNINTFYEDPDLKGKIIWFGTWGDGLGLFDRTKDKFIFYRNDPNNKNSLSNNVVRSITKDRFGMLWIGTDNGLNKFDEKTKSFTRFFNDPNNLSTINNNFIKKIYEDSQGDLWILLNGGGLDLYDRVNDRFIHYANDPGIPNSLNDNIVWCIQEDADGILWLGTNAGGLNRFDKKTKLFTHFINDPKNPNSISDNKILCLHKDKIGNLWVGTAGGGLNKFDVVKQKFQVFSIENGLASNTVHSIVEDDQNNLWISTTKGISKFDIQKELFINYDMNDGLQADEFHVNASYKSITGELFFGGINGFNVFRPEQIQRNNYIPKIVITDFLLNNKSVPIGKGIDSREILTKSITETERVTLSYRDEVFSIQYASLDFTAHRKNMYAYKLEGFETEWNYVGNRNYATYTKLPAGSYKLLIKGSNHNGIWNEEGISLEIIITPPFWETWWFRTFSILFIVGVVMFSYKKRTARIYAYNLELETHVAERTEQLEHANRELEAFSYSVSHDLRAPLRAIDGYSKMFLEDYRETIDKDGQELLNGIRSNSQKMALLINDLLLLSRIGRSELRPQMIDMEGSIKSVLNELINNLEPSKYKIIVHKLPKAEGDQLSIRLVWTNLISNALKFSSKKDFPEIEIGCIEKELEKIYFIKDNGEGFDQQNEQGLFGVFQQYHSKDEFGGNGIGLAIVQRIIQRHNGKIWAKGELNKGAAFYFTLKLVEP